MQCMFLRRGYDVTLPVSKIFASARRIVGAAVNNADTVGSFVDISFDNMPSTGLYYVFSVCNGYIGIYKFKDNIWYETPIVEMSSQYAHIEFDSRNRRIRYNGTGSDASPAVHSAQLEIFSFDGWPEEIIDKALSEAVYTRVAGRESSSSQTITNVSITGDAAYVASRGYLGLYKISNGTLVPLYESATVPISGDSYVMPVTVKAAYGQTVVGIS